MTPLLIAQIGLTLFVFVMLLNSAAIMVYVERKVAAMLQQRLGPYLVGPKGLLQPLADIIKLLFKEFPERHHDFAQLAISTIECCKQNGDLAAGEDAPRELFHPLTE